MTHMCVKWYTLICDRVALWCVERLLLIVWAVLVGAVVVGTIAPLRLGAAVRLNSKNRQITTKLGQVPWGIFEDVTVSGPSIENNVPRRTTRYANWSVLKTILLDKFLQDFRRNHNILAEYHFFGTDGVRTERYMRSTVFSASIGESVIVRQVIHRSYPAYSVFQTMGWRNPNIVDWHCEQIELFSGDRIISYLWRRREGNKCSLHRVQSLCANFGLCFSSFSRSPNLRILFDDFSKRILRSLDLLMSEVSIEPRDDNQCNGARCLNPYRCFMEIATSTAFSALALWLWVYGGAAIGLRWWWRTACWLGCVICVISCWRIIHIALDYRCWFG